MRRCLNAARKHVLIRRSDPTRQGRVSKHARRSIQHTVAQPPAQPALPIWGAPRQPLMRTYHELICDLTRFPPEPAMSEAVIHPPPSSCYHLLPKQESRNFKGLLL